MPPLPRRYAAAVLLILTALVFAGCGAPETLKETNRLNADAARQQQADAEAIDRLATALEQAQPQAAADLHALAAAIRTAGKNIEAGSAVIERYEGPPANPVPYTPTAHTATIVKANTDLDQREKIQQGIETFFTKTLGSLADKAVPGAGVLITGVALWALNAYRKMKTAFKTVANKVEDNPELKGQIAQYASHIGEAATVKWAVDKVGVSGGPPAVPATGPAAPPAPLPPVAAASPAPAVALLETGPAETKTRPE
jgi:hypothetical protein